MTHLESTAAVSVALFNAKHHDWSFLSLQEKEETQRVDEVLHEISKSDSVFGF